MLLDIFYLMSFMEHKEINEILRSINVADSLNTNISQRKLIHFFVLFFVVFLFENLVPVSSALRNFGLWKNVMNLFVCGLFTFVEW